ncbi:MAG TPA: GGDEF domain-containing protein [Xanthomonadaceae bacterium]|jgi:diguanylate cyclase (GGDEF)-like protein|nr:GGDEF domain-containing protein [Xanthomonadaceae bacterium]
MRRWLPLTLLALLCCADIGVDRAVAQGMRGPPPPPPGQNMPPPGNGLPPPSPGDNNVPSGQPPFPPPQMQGQQRPGQDQPQQNPQPPGQQQQPQGMQPQQVVAPAPIVPAPTPVAASTSAAATTATPASVASDAQPATTGIASATIDPDAAAWAREASAPSQGRDGSGKPGKQNPSATASSMAPIARMVEWVPIWVWGIAAALPIALLLLTMTLRKTARLADETRRLARDQRQLQSAHRFLQNESEHLRHLAINDPLTGTLNRRAFADELRTLLDHLEKFRRPLNLMVFDLDHFKSINDQQGHLAGDIALKLVAGVVRKHLNSDDLFGRFGGDEFLIACADRSLDEAAKLADSIRRGVVEESTTCKPPLPGLSLSIGIARASPESGYHVEALFQRADTALYSAKHGGRNRVVLASDDLPRPPASEVVTRQLA